MKSLLLASMCLAYDSNGDCVDRQVFVAQAWDGPTSAVQCEDEMTASLRRLKQEGYERMFQLECETTSGSEEVD